MHCARDVCTCCVNIVSRTDELVESMERLTVPIAPLNCPNQAGKTHTPCPGNLSCLGTKIPFIFYSSTYGRLEIEISLSHSHCLKLRNRDDKDHIKSWSQGRICGVKIEVLQYSCKQILIITITIRESVSPGWSVIGKVLIPGPYYSKTFFKIGNTFKSISLVICLYNDTQNTFN